MILLLRKFYDLSLSGQARKLLMFASRNKSLAFFFIIKKNHLFDLLFSCRNLDPGYFTWPFTIIWNICFVGTKSTWCNCFSFGVPPSLPSFANNEVICVIYHFSEPCHSPQPSKCLLHLHTMMAGKKRRKSRKGGPDHGTSRWWLLMIKHRTLPSFFLMQK